METPQKIGLAILGLVVVGGGLYLYSKGNSASAAVPAGGGAPVSTIDPANPNAIMDPIDAQYYELVKQAYATKQGHAISDYYLQDALSRFNNNNMAAEYQINGQPSRIGALMASIATSYGTPNGLTQAANDATWDVFRAFRKAKLAL